MTIRNIQIFLTVCREGCSITDAAKKLYISQPSVSAAIRTLENELGTPLFERLSKRLYLTESGKTFLTYAQRILLLYDELNSSFAEGNENEPLRIGASITIGSTILPDLAKRFSKAYPDSRLKVQIRRSRVLQEMIKANELDMALVETPIEDPLLPVEKFFESSLEVIAPADYPEASLSLEKLTSLPLILREKGSGTRDLFDRVLASRSVAAEPVWERHRTRRPSEGADHRGRAEEPCPHCPCGRPLLSSFLLPCNPPRQDPHGKNVGIPKAGPEIPHRGRREIEQEGLRSIAAWHSALSRRPWAQR